METGGKFHLKKKTTTKFSSQSQTSPNLQVPRNGTESSLQVPPNFKVPPKLQKQITITLPSQVPRWDTVPFQVPAGIKEKGNFFRGGIWEYLP